jgi:DNA-binding CsgD family transcriptional regulator
MMPLSQQSFSDLVGKIYDCAIDPTLWPGTIQQICGEMRSPSGVIRVVDLQGSSNLVAHSWNIAPETLVRYADWQVEYFKLFSGFLLTHPLDEPFVGSRIDYTPLLAGTGKSPTYSLTQYDQSIFEKARAGGVLPNGFLGKMVELSLTWKVIDSLSTIVLRNRSRLGLFGVYRDQSGGYFTDNDVADLALLAPHIRRAITISDLLNLKTLEAQALAAALDGMALGVVILAADCRVLHANEAAKCMLAAGVPLRTAAGRLHACGSADEELVRAIALAEDETAIGKLGIAIRLQGYSEGIAVGHVLPLSCGKVRRRLFPQAVAALFITQSGQPMATDLSGIAAVFQLTPAETRILRELACGASTRDIAAAFGVTEGTAKTHLKRIFAKTGVRRQAELVALIKDIVPATLAGEPAGTPAAD